MLRLPPRRWSLVLAVLGATALAGVLAFGGVLAPGVGPVDGPGPTATPAATPAPAPTDTAAATTPVVGLAGVPGVSEAGIADPATLARHHDRTLGSNYTLWMDLYWRSAADLTDGWHQRDAALYDTETAGEETPTVRRLGPGEGSPSRVPEPAALRSETLARLLDTPLTAYTGRVEHEGESSHRVVATGSPSGPLPTPDRGFVPSRAVRNYSAVVLFDEAGHLERVEVWYTLVDSPDPIAIRFRVAYDRRGTTTVTRPSWVDARTAESDAFRDGNG